MLSFLLHVLAPPTYLVLHDSWYAERQLSIVVYILPIIILIIFNNI